MSKRKHVTFGGQGQHEFYLPATGKGQKNRRDRRRCEYYQTASKYCVKIHGQCVGPTLCRKYQTAGKREKHQTNQIRVGTMVSNKRGKEGTIVTISQDICTIQFATGKKVSAKYPDVFEQGIFNIKK